MKYRIIEEYMWNHVWNHWVEKSWMNEYRIIEESVWNHWVDLNENINYRRVCVKSLSWLEWKYRIIEESVWNHWVDWMRI